jgi:acetolactate synthase small subunit
LSDILRDLCSNNFDTRCLNADPEKRNKFLSILAEFRYKEMERTGALDAF